MNDRAVKRRLAAILSADVVGYSKLMGADDEGTLKALRQVRRDFVDPAIAGNSGRIFKTTGDGLLAEFASAVDAVRAAITVQKALADRADGAGITFRIGVNLGDVIIEGDDVFGDGVNVAARLQEMAEPGAVFMSSIVHDQVAGKLEQPFADLGERAAKNIARPIRVFAWRAADTAPARRVAPPIEQASIVVLPFDNMSGDPEQSYFSDGITEDIITDLSRLSGLMVIARNSSFAYKGKSIDLRQVTRDLGVRYALEGSVRKAGNRVRVNAQLIDGASGGHLWAERFDRDLHDIFAVQDEVTQHIVAALKLKLKPQESKRTRRGTDNLEAYDIYLRARELRFHLTRENIAEARVLFEQSIKLDPGFSAAYAGLAMTYSVDYLNRWTTSWEAALGKSIELAQQAVALDPNEPDAHFALGATLVWRRQHEAAIASAERALALEPNYAPARAGLALILHYAGRSAEALEQLALSKRIDPYYSDIFLHFTGQAHYSLGNWEEAAKALEERVARNPHTDISRVLLAACYGQLGRLEEARAMWTEALRVNPEYSFEHRRRTLPYKDPKDFDRVVEGLRRAGISV